MLLYLYLCLYLDMYMYWSTIQAERASGRHLAQGLVCRAVRRKLTGQQSLARPPLGRFCERVSLGFNSGCQLNRPDTTHLFIPETL